MKYPSKADAKDKDKAKVDISALSPIQELDGKLRLENVDDKLMHSVLENDKDSIDEGMLIEEALNRGVGAFTPDLMFEKLVKNFTMTKSLFGDALIRAVSGYDAEYLEKNIGIPEFQRELKKKIKDRLEKFNADGVIDKQGMITEKGIELASLIMCIQELESIIPKGIHGERVHKKHYIYGDKQDVRNYRKGDRYKDVAIKKAAKTAIRRGHSSIGIDDLKTYERQSKGEVYIIYALDASGSMKGEKIGTCKKAGVALAYKAIQERDRVGLIVFGTEVKEAIAPTTDFGLLLNAITRVRASAETDMAATIQKAVEIFPVMDVTKHLLLLSDALPTKGEDPEKATLEAASMARAHGITISLIGINLDMKGKRMAEKLVEIGRGKLYIVKDLKEIDKIVLEDYYSVMYQRMM
ncbi:VWA domain-containing protein [Candidatus Woesearchaeota archaeon]|nr:VWA domain-containing protein [Candidatus Woesearchaeota archaeon]